MSQKNSLHIDMGHCDLLIVPCVHCLYSQNPTQLKQTHPLLSINDVSGRWREG